MGTVSSVFMKYVAISTASYATLCYLAPKERSDQDGFLFNSLLSTLAYMSVLNAGIAILFKCEWGMAVLGKDEVTGAVPIWSYIAFVGFHLPTWMYTSIHRIQDRMKGIQVADEVAAGWWLGGRYGHELDKTWAGVVDLTCEFPESCRVADPDSYLLLRCWDGVPPTVAQLQRAAEFAVRRSSVGDVLVHCAHGRGRSTTVACACLVKAGLFGNWEEAFQAIQKKRHVVKLNKRMRSVLAEWQQLHDADSKDK